MSNPNFMTNIVDKALSSTLGSFPSLPRFPARAIESYTPFLITHQFFSNFSGTDCLLKLLRTSTSRLMLSRDKLTDDSRYPTQGDNRILSKYNLRYSYRVVAL